MTFLCNLSNLINIFINRVILSCAVLHNICNMRNLPMDPLDIDALPDHPENYHGNEDGLRYRNVVANTFF